MPNAEIQLGALFERDGKSREVVRLIPANRYTSPASLWQRMSTRMDGLSAER